MDANWKADRILKELESSNPKVETPEEQRQKARAAGVPLPEFQEVIRVQRDGHRVNFFVEPNTKFLERISVIK